jgi:hypothetical protein
MEVEAHSEERKLLYFSMKNPFQIGNVLTMTIILKKKAHHLAVGFPPSITHCLN